MDSPERLAQSVVAPLRRRLELLALEVAEEEIRFGRLLGWQFASLFFLCFAVVLLLMFAVALYWDTPQRLQALGAAAGLALALAAAAGWIYRSRRRRKPPPFAETVAQLRKDAQALESAG